MIELHLQRLRHNVNTTIGRLTDGFIKLATCEDGPTASSVNQKPRIKAGRYEIKLRNVISPKTTQYRKIYPWFKFHLELQNVPDRKYIYVHHGNTYKDTLGCILVGEMEYEWSIGESRAGFAIFYHYVIGALMAGSRVFITIEDEDGN